MIPRGADLIEIKKKCRTIGHRNPRMTTDGESLYPWVYYIRGYFPSVVAANWQLCATAAHRRQSICERSALIVVRPRSGHHPADGTYLSEPRYASKSATCWGVMSRRSNSGISDCCI